MLDCCVGKFQHKSKRAALLVMARMKRPRMKVYKCPHCRFWHIGGDKRLP